MRQLLCSNKIACLAMNGWTNIIGDNVITNIAVAPSCSLMLDNVYVDNECHNAEWVADQVQRLFDEKEIGATFIGACMDNNSTNQSAWAILTNRYPKRYFFGCFSHCLHLLGADIFYTTNNELTGYPSGYPFEHLVNFVDVCKEIVNFFKNDHKDNNELGGTLKAVKLDCLNIVAGVTYWGFILNMLKSLSNSYDILFKCISQDDFIITSIAEQKQQREKVKQYLFV